MDTIKIADIKIGERRREDLGDIAALAKSIRQYGLLAPPVLTDDGTLVAGQRRVEAMKLLGWTETLFVNKGKLTAERLHEIELEENIRRKDFMEYEISKNMVALAEAVSKRLVEESRFLSTVDKSPMGGRPCNAGNMQAVADEMDVPRTTILRAKDHVAAVEAYPVQATAPCGEKQKLSTLPVNPLTEEQQAELDRDLAKNAHDADIARKFVNAMTAIQTLEITLENVESWIKFERMPREEIEDAHDDVRDCVSRFERIEQLLTGMNKLRIVR